jgi:hypothetical protein
MSSNDNTVFTTDKLTFNLPAPRPNRGAYITLVASHPIKIRAGKNGKSKIRWPGGVIHEHQDGCTEVYDFFSNGESWLAMARPLNT